jgi:predicted HAD superfamily Cof-like phosphohydrolase
MRPRQTQQRDLFETDRATAEIPAARRMTLVRLIERLLVEAVAECEAAAQAGGLETREAGHEQDHA